MTPPGPWATIYYYSVSQHGYPQDKAALLSLLDATEQQRVERYRFDHLKWTFATARWILKSELATILGVKARDVALTYSDNGKPSFVDYPHIHFSITHTDSAIGVAISDRLVGIDIEQHDRRGNPWREPESFLNTQVAENMKDLNDDAERKACFARYWTAMEALVKYRGSALFREKDSFGADLPVLAHDGEFCSQGLAFETMDTGFHEQLTVCTPDHHYHQQRLAFDGSAFSQY